jgi:hypothetical protein
MSKRDVEREREEKKKRRTRRVKPPRLTDSVRDFHDRTAISIPTIYRMMADGRLRYVQVTPDMRRIPVGEYVRLGLASDIQEVA